MEDFNFLALFYQLGPILLGALLTAFWGRSQKILKALKELGDVLSAIATSAADKQIDKGEMEKIKIEIAEAVAAFKAIVK